MDLLHTSCVQIVIVDAVYCRDFADVEGKIFAAGHHGHYEAGSCIGHHQKR